jgi:hypothetical protein
MHGDDASVRDISKGDQKSWLCVISKCEDYRKSSAVAANLERDAYRHEMIVE